jgi:anaphase-promoting complex subunit 5
MPRYLTPARVCLLALIHIYQSRQTSSESSLDVLDFIAQHVVTSPEGDDIDDIEHIAIAQSRLSTFTAKLHQWASEVPGRSVNDVLLQFLWAINGIDALNELFTTLRASVASTSGITTEGRRLTPASPLGQFVRRCYVEYTRLPFADVQNLWNVFVDYRAPSYDDWAGRNPHAAMALENDKSPWENSATLRRMRDADINEHACVSALDTENLLGFAVHQLQKLGTRVPTDVRSRLQTWIREQCEPGSQPLQYFMAFFENWRAGQYTMALESLHQYFDYSLAARTGSDTMRVFYQYALLHLSVLHADFECWSESIDAMNECIATGWSMTSSNTASHTFANVR